MLKLHNRRGWKHRLPKAGQLNPPQVQISAPTHLCRFGIATVCFPSNKAIEDLTDENTKLEVLGVASRRRKRPDLRPRDHILASRPVIYDLWRRIYFLVITIGGVLQIL